MLYYLVGYLVFVGSFASEQKVLEPDFPNLLSLIGNNASASTLLSQVLNVRPEQVSEVIVLVEKLIEQGNKEIATLDENLKKATLAVETSQAAYTKSELVVAARKKDLDNALAAQERAKIAYDNAVRLKNNAGIALDKAKQHHKAVLERWNKEKPYVQAQVKTFHEVLTLLYPVIIDKFKPCVQEIDCGGLTCLSGKGKIPVNTVNHLRPGKSYTVTVDYIAMGSWDKEIGTVFVNGKVCGRKTFFWSTMMLVKKTTCGVKPRSRIQATTFSCKAVADKQGALKISASSNLNQGFADERFGVRNLKVKLLS